MRPCTTPTSLRWWYKQRPNSLDNNHHNSYTTKTTTSKHATTTPSQHKRGSAATMASWRQQWQQWQQRQQQQWQWQRWGKNESDNLGGRFGGGAGFSIITIRVHYCSTSSVCFTIDIIILYPGFPWIWRNPKDQLRLVLTGLFSVSTNPKYGWTEDQTTVTVFTSPYYFQSWSVQVRSSLSFFPVLRLDFQTLQVAVASSRGYWWDQIFDRGKPPFLLTYVFSFVFFWYTTSGEWLPLRKSECAGTHICSHIYLWGLELVVLLV